MNFRATLRNSGRARATVIRSCTRGRARDWMARSIYLFLSVSWPHCECACRYYSISRRQGSRARPSCNSRVAAPPSRQHIELDPAQAGGRTACWPACRRCCRRNVSSVAPVGAPALATLPLPAASAVLHNPAAAKAGVTLTSGAGWRLAASSRAGRPDGERRRREEGVAHKPGQLYFPRGRRWSWKWVGPPPASQLFRASKPTPTFQLD